MHYLTLSNISILFSKSVVHTFCQQVTQKAKMYLYVSFYISGVNKRIEDFLVLFVLSDQGKKNSPMRKTPPISQAFYWNSNNWFTGSLKQKMETNPQHSMCSVLEAFQAKSTQSLFLHLPRVQPAGPTETHQPSPAVTLIYKHRGTKMHLSWPTLATSHSDHKQPSWTGSTLVWLPHLGPDVFHLSAIHSWDCVCYRLQTGVL